MRLSGSGFGFLWGVPVLSGLVTLVAVVILARVGGRLLGIRMRWRRAILAGFAGLALGWIAAWSINGQRRGPQTLSWPVVLFGALIATMLIAVLLDLTVPAAVLISAGIPAVWWLAAAGTLLIRAREAPSAAGLPSGAAA